jgi:hypothetical protein
VAGNAPRDPAEALEDLRREWREDPDNRREIEFVANKVQIIDLILRPADHTTT